ncbi:MarR family transcriptional regulator [Streptomyces peucetius]|uniref:MarR family transcriptional regulator n=1 Tax=Streptomyces peucetius TaxID=1950 RepID=UPI00299F63A2|nr:MarR family transcriptional regulator [Streptomyces peucetius]
MADHVDLVLRQWGAQRPDLDVSPMAVIGRLSRAGQLIGAELARTFAEHGLDRASFDVLATLRRSGPAHRLTPAGLMRSAMVTSGAITQRLDRLEARGLVTRTPSESDRRVVHVELTREGLALVDRTLPDHLATEHRVLAALTGPERRGLAGTLRRLLESLGDTAAEEILNYESEFCESVPAGQAPRNGPIRIEYGGERDADGSDADESNTDKSDAGESDGDASGSAGGRPELNRALAIARDIRRTAPERPVVLTVARLGLLAPTSSGLAAVARELREHGIGLEILTGPLSGVHDPEEPGATLFGVLVEAAELERGSRPPARKRPARGGGRPKVIDDDMLVRARSLRDQGVPVSEIAARLTIRTGRNAGQHPSVASLYRALAQDRREDRQP